jgi:hypothetical protein
VAVSAAIPFLQLAKSVQVISVDQDASRRKASQAEALAYLRCHGIGATAQVHVHAEIAAAFLISCSTSLIFLVRRHSFC